MQKLIDALEDLDDVQDVYTSAVLESGLNSLKNKGRLKFQTAFYIETNQIFLVFNQAQSSSNTTKLKYKILHTGEGDAE